jgi:predicted transcriptional regulator
MRKHCAEFYEKNWRKPTDTPMFAAKAANRSEFSQSVRITRMPKIQIELSLGLPAALKTSCRF